MAKNCQVSIASKHLVFFFTTFVSSCSLTWHPKKTQTADGWAGWFKPKKFNVFFVETCPVKDNVWRSWSPTIQAIGIPNLTHFSVSETCLWMPVLGIFGVCATCRFQAFTPQGSRILAGKTMLFARKKDSSAHEIWPKKRTAMNGFYHVLSWWKKLVIFWKVLAVTSSLILSTWQFRSSLQFGGPGPMGGAPWPSIFASPKSMRCWSLSQHLDRKSKMIHPWNLTWNLKITHLGRKIIFQTFSFGFKMLIFQGVDIWVNGYKVGPPLHIVIYRIYINCKKHTNIVAYISFHIY